MSLCVKRTNLKIQSEAAFVRDVKAELRRIDDGEFPAQAVVSTSFNSLLSLHGNLTPKRLKILHAIKRKHPKTVSELAKQLKLPIREISAEIHTLANLGFIDAKPRASSNQKTDTVNEDSITIAIPL